MRRFFVSLALVFGVLIRSAFADPAEVIAKARTYLGPEDALNSVHSLHYVGTVEDQSGAEKSTPYGIDMVFQKDFQQRLTLTRPNVTDITGLDDYEAWHRSFDPAKPQFGPTVLYSKTTVKQLRAGTWENMAFFAGIEKIGGSVVDDGMTTVDGHPAHQLSFVHEPGLVYVRYFEPETGKLLLTKTDEGVQEIREEGEIIANGIRFPKKIINAISDGQGHTKTITISIDKVTVNESFPDNTFSVPLLVPKR